MVRDRSGVVFLIWSDAASKLQPAGAVVNVRGER